MGVALFNVLTLLSDDITFSPPVIGGGGSIYVFGTIVCDKLHRHSYRQVMWESDLRIVPTGVHKIREAGSSRLNSVACWKATGLAGEDGPRLEVEVKLK